MFLDTDRYLKGRTYKPQTMKNAIMKSMGLYLNALALVSPAKAGRRGFELFCRPLRVPVRDYHQSFLNSADLFSFEFQDATIQGYRWGTGKKNLLFLHGWQSHTFRWKAYIEKLLSNNGYTIYALDAPGHGLSKGKLLNVPLYTDLIHSFIERTGEFHAMIGHSLGAFSSLYAFHLKPLLPVRRLVVMASPGEATDFMEFYRKSLGLSKKSFDVIVDHFVQRIKQVPEYFSAPAFAASVNIPGLIIHDTEDAEAPYPYAKAINRNWRKSKLITTEGLGHNLKSREVIRTVVDFIENDLVYNQASAVHEHIH